MRPAPPRPGWDGPWPRRVIGLVTAVIGLAGILVAAFGNIGEDGGPTADGRELIALLAAGGAAPQVPGEMAMEMRLETRGLITTSRMRMTMDPRAGRSALQSTVEFPGVPPSNSPSTRTFMVVTDGPTKYVQMDPVPAGLVAVGKHWVRLPDEPAASLASELASAAPSFAGQMQQAEKVGSEVIDGVPTTRFRAELPADQAFFGRGNGLPGGAGFEQLGIDVIRMDLWVDGDGRLRRMSYAGSGGTTRMEVTTTFRYDETITVELPPEHEVVVTSSRAEAAALLGVPEAAVPGG